MTEINHGQGLKLNPQKGSSAPGRPTGVFIGKVTRTSGGVYVSIPSLTGGLTNINFGPCKVVGLYPTVGSAVLCTFLENRNDDVVILGKIIATNILQNTGTPVVATDATTKQYVDEKVTILQTQINSLQTALTALTNRYNSHVAHPPPA